MSSQHGSLARSLSAARALAGLATLLIAAGAIAQTTTSTPPPSSAGSVPITYVGSNARLGIGITNDADLAGEFQGVLPNAAGNAALIAEAWFESGGAGGVKLSRNWLWGGMTRDDATTRPDAITVAKAFVAVDQNVFDDRKASIGIGMERERWFGDVYLSAGLTDEREVASVTDITRTTLTGTTPAGRPFTRERTVTTITRGFEKAYEHGVGARVGRFFDDAQARLRGGLDYEWGDFDSHQTTASIGVEKFIPGSGHSFALELEALRRDGDFVRDESDTRAWLLWRYDFGGASAYRAVTPYRDVEIRTGVEAAPAAPVVVRNEVGMDAAAFFRLDRFELSDSDRSELAAIVDAINSDRRISRIAVTGHTCDLGPEAYNQQLSERRARAVADFLIANGVDAAELDVRGDGETDPRFPNDGEPNRGKNRRVDVAFMTVETRETPAEAPPAETRVEWQREVVPAPAAWIERALRNPADHKRTVDAYRFETVERTETLGPEVLVNRPPVAVDDAATVLRNASANPIAVLANDSDPDGDPLSVTQVSTPANGTATSGAGGIVLYVPRTGFTGSDTFTYTISDGRLSATATVRITVNAAPPTLVADSASTRRNTPVTLNVLTNDSDPAGGALTLTALGTPANGSVTFTAAGQVTYTPRQGFAGQDTFTYRARNEAGIEAESRVTVTVAADPPVANPDSASTSFATAVTVNVLANDTDPAGEALTLLSVSTPASGTLTFSAQGAVTYRPSTTFFGGTETLTYRIRNPAGVEASSTVTFTVAAPLPPIAVEDFRQGDGVNPTVIDVLTNDRDPQGLRLTVVSVTIPTRGTATILADNSVRYQPTAALWCGIDTFLYTIRNEAGLTAISRVVVQRAPLGSMSTADAKNCPVN